MNKKSYLQFAEFTKRHDTNLTLSNLSSRVSYISSPYNCEKGVPIGFRLPSEK